MRFPFFLISVILSLPAWSPGDARSGETYYMILFGIQDSLNNPRNAHSMGTFVKVTRQQGNEIRFEEHTISWRAGSGYVSLVRPTERGENHGLQQTLDDASDRDLKISQWGPFQIQPELYYRALRQITRLRCGVIGWKAIDRQTRLEGTASNCIHVISDLDTEFGFIQTGTARGNAATRLIAKHLERWMINPREVHHFVSDLLPLNCYCITRRSLRPTCP